MYYAETPRARGLAIQTFVLGGDGIKGARDDGAMESMTACRLVVDTSAKLVTCGGVEVTLTATEYAILALLSRHPGWVHSADEISLSVWGYAHYSTSVSVHIAHIRRKLNAACSGDYIETMRGLGYRLAAKAVEAPPRSQAVRERVHRRQALSEVDGFYRRLTELLNGNGTARPTLALITGAEGIGKTTCLREARLMAISSGWLPIWLDCRLASENHMPTWHFAATTLSGHGVAGVSIPHVYDSDSPANQDVPAEFERHCEMVEAMAAQRPVLMLFDDADHMDDHSARLLAHLASRCSEQAFGMVVAAQDTHWRLRRHLSEHSDGHYELRGLSTEAVRDVLEQEGLGWLTESEAEAFTAVTSGTPERVLDLAREVRTLAPAIALNEEMLIGLALTPRRRSSLAGKLAEMGSDRLDVLRWIAALENDADPCVLDSLTRSDGARAWQCLQSALDCGEITVSPTSARLSISDPLLARLIFEHMTPSEREQRQKLISGLPHE